MGYHTKYQSLMNLISGWHLAGSPRATGKMRLTGSPSRDLQTDAASPILTTMSTVQEIESAITQLPLEEKEAIRDWLEEAIEQQLEVSDEFRAKIQRARQELATGISSRVRQPEADR